MTTLNDNALIDLDYYFTMSGDSQDDHQERNYLEALINAISLEFEKFCNRRLKARDYTYESEILDGEGNPIANPSYREDLLHYCIFDAPIGDIFWFPTYPVNSLTSIYITDILTSEASSDDYVADYGYLLYKRRGKLVYRYGFDYPYLQNVKVIWNGGYANDSEEMSDLKYLCFVAVQQYISNPENQLMQSERMGNYTYKLVDPNFQQKLKGMSPTVFENLMFYRKAVIG